MPLPSIQSYFSNFIPLQLFTNPKIHPDIPRFQNIPRLLSLVHGQPAQIIPRSLGGLQPPGWPALVPRLLRPQRPALPQGSQLLSLLPTAPPDSLLPASGTSEAHRAGAQVNLCAPWASDRARRRGVAP